MPLRLNKRQQRELEELNALGAVPGDDETGLSEDVSTSSPPQKATISSAFATLETEDISEDDEELEEVSATKSKPKKVGLSLYFAASLLSNSEDAYTAKEEKEERRCSC